MFVGLHVLLAERIDAPELAISMEEGDQFMKAAQNVMRHYSVQTTQKALDWIAFGGCAAGMYIPRIAGIGMRKRQGRPASAVRSSAPSRPNGGVQTATSQAAPAEGQVIVPDAFSQTGFSEAAE